jgi:sterol desaturase/sphingolipid hydroxylase (fatty acid hydroxylase superfamily)
VLNASAMFNHANVALPLGLDRLLRRVVVTPDMHRVHHSTVRDETDTNYGFFLSVWDHLFGTHRAEPAAGQLGMEVGLPSFRAAREAWLDRLLTQPFRRPAA